MCGFTNVWFYEWWELRRSREEGIYEMGGEERKEQRTTNLDDLNAKGHKLLTQIKYNIKLIRYGL